jgi:hypothetical protein
MSTLPRVRAIRFLLIAVGAFAASRSVDAQNNYQWNVANGDFTVGGNWTPAGPPQAGDNAAINNGGTATLATGTSVGNLDVASAPGSSGTLAINNGQLNATQVHFGESGAATVTVTNGFLESDDDIFVGGENGAGTGTMTLSGATSEVLAADDIIFGRTGTGTLNMSGGRLRGGYTVVGKFGTGTWNHSGGVFDQDFGDIEIGDGGTPSQEGTPGPRTGTINLTGGVIRASGHFAIGNRKGGGEVNISGGALDVTGDANGTGTIFVGRGNDWAGNPGVGNPVTLRVIGGSSVIAANGAFSMNPDNVASSSTLVARLTGTSHSAIRVAGDALIDKGTFKAELCGFTPTAGNSWTILEAGADLTTSVAAIDAIVAAGGYPALVHNPASAVGSLMGTFKNTDFSMAPLGSGLSWQVSYANNKVTLSVVGTSTFSADFNDDGRVNAADLAKWKGDFGTGNGSDADGDGDSDGNDFLLWQRQLGSGGPAAPAAAAVPEPSTALMLALAASMFASAVHRAPQRRS